MKQNYDYIQLNIIVLYIHVPWSFLWRLDH